MPGVAFVNGQYVPHEEAATHIEDRGFQFADGVYEVWFYSSGKLFDCDDHFSRLEFSLGELGIAMPMSARALETHLRRVARRNRLKEGIIYLQVTRGVAPRDHAFPGKGLKPTVVITARSLPLKAMEAKAQKGVSVITCPDERWARCDIKSIALLPNALAKQKAREAGAYEAWLLDDAGRVVEGSSSTAWIVEETVGKTKLRTRQLDHGILRGVTGTHLKAILEAEDLELEEGAFTPKAALAAKEAFITSATNLIMPVVNLDGITIGNGKPGPVTSRLRLRYLDEVLG